MNYIKALRDWSDSWERTILESKEFGTNKTTWVAAVRTGEQFALTHKDIVQRIQHEIIDPMIEFNKQNYAKSVVHAKKVKEFEKDFEHIQKPWLKLLSKIKDAKAAYQERHEKLIQAERAQQIIKSNPGASPEEKTEVQQTVNAYMKECAHLRSKYEKTFEEMKQLRPQYEKDMKKVLDRMHDFERERLNKFKQLFTAFHSVINIQNNQHIIEMPTKFQNAIASHDPDKDIQWWNRHYGSATVTHWPQFEELTD